MGELAARMDAAEFSEWVAFAGLEPFGSRVEDLRAGTVASAAVAAAGGKTNPGDWFKWQPADAKPAGGWKHIFGAFGAWLAKPKPPAEGKAG